MDKKQLFRDSQFGLMMHFGLYTLLEGEWKGQRMPFIGEWIQSYFKIPNEEYHRLANAFNPIYFNADEIVKLAKDAGMKYIVITSKHHEGFALFRSKVSKFNTVDGTPCHRDLIEELANACAKENMGLGLYYSQELDWEHPHGGGYGVVQDNMDGAAHWGNDWDFTDETSKNYEICLQEKILPQMDEILTQYGDLLLMWCDVPLVITPDQSRRIYELIKSRQPDCLVNSRIGNGVGDYISAGDNEIPKEKDFDLLYESPATLNDTWGYKSFDQNWKTPEEVVRTRDHLKKLGANYLLNVGPDPLGRIPAAAADILRKVGKM